MKNFPQYKMVWLNMKIKKYDSRTRTNKEGTAPPPLAFS
jgi:hypothetical protein